MGNMPPTSFDERHDSDVVHFGSVVLSKHLLALSKDYSSWPKGLSLADTVFMLILRGDFAIFRAPVRVKHIWPLRKYGHRRRRKAVYRSVCVSKRHRQSAFCILKAPVYVFLCYLNVPSRQSIQLT
jgi:hypothetical protein